MKELEVHLSQYVTGTGKNGHQIKFKFPNGYGASLINDGYGSSAHPYEIAVLGIDGHLDYTTPITDDVLGHLSGAEAMSILEDIKAL